MILAAMGAAATLFLAEAEAIEVERLRVFGRDLDPGRSAAIGRLEATDLEPIAPTHPAEIFARMPGVWVTRGSGQEHLSAIRSPLLTGAGGCGALLILEEGVPIRPPGFCNVNNLFELNLLQADSISVLRGPGGIGHASGGLHGVIDVRTPSPAPIPAGRIGLTTGSDGYDRLELEATADLGQRGRLRVDGNFTDAGSFRDDEGYSHQLLSTQHRVSTGWGQLSTFLSAARLDQDTAGFITGFRAYQDPVLRTRNDNPEAFRRGTAVRLISRAEWRGSGDAENRLSFFARRSRMSFLQHFLPGKPLERNGQISGGLQFDRRQVHERFEIKWGLDAELFSGFLFETQDQPAAGPPPVSAIRPLGRHYDYEVDGQRAGGYLAADWSSGAWRASAGVHVDWIRYQYSTNLAPGNLAEDGSACDFGGCLFNRPEDRSDRFAQLAPELTVSRWFVGGTAWLRLARGLRAPQATELYRLQRGQDVADLDVETLDAIELGARGWHAGLDWSLAAFVQRKQNFIFRDAEGFNVSDGRIRSQGIEFELRQTLGAGLSAGAQGHWTKHQYRFDRALGGEVIMSGKDVSSAPRRIGSVDLSWRGGERWLAQLAYESTGRYYLDAANTRRYSGHGLWHGYVRRDFGPSWSASFRVRNLSGRRYAERADFAFGQFRYFPGAGRSVFLSLEYRTAPGS